MKHTKKGFTLLEILLVIGLIAILAGITIVAINPGRQIGQANDTQKISDVNTILNAVYQYTLDNSGFLPDGNGVAINATLQVVGEETAACTTATFCPSVTQAAACIDLADDLVGTTSKYILSMPVNPNSNTINAYDQGFTGYYISKDVNERITVGSCENDVDGNPISVTR
jgi:prepilin-type N-terminal cleavage/methylation domain-containing protein